MTQLTLEDFSTYSDEELLEKIRQDNDKAFAEIFERYWKRIHAITFSKLGNHEATREIVQEIFLSLWDRRKTLLIHNFSQYIFGCVRFKCLDQIYRKHSHEKYWAYYKQLLEESEESTAHTVEYDDLMDALQAGMERLPEKSKKVFRLSRLEGRSIREIAAALNLSEKAIEYHLTRSLKELRLHLKDFIIPFLTVFGLF